MSNRTSPFNQTKLVNFPINIDGPLAQSILTLSNSSIFSTSFSVLGYCLTGLIVYWVVIIPTTLAEVESIPNGLQSLKKSDDRNNMPFDQEERILKAFRDVTAAQSEDSGRATIITSSWRRTLRYWVAIHGKLGGMFHGVHLFLPLLAFKWIEDQAELGVSRQLKSLNDELSLPSHILVEIAVNASGTFIRIVSDILAMPLGVTCIWHILSWQISNFHSQTHWPPLQRLMSRQGIRFLIRQMPRPILPSKVVLRHTLLPTLVSSVVPEVRKFYPESIIHTLFVAIYGTNARPKVFVAAAILAEGTITSFLFYILPHLLGILTVRMQASFLPEDVQPIVPIDRAFGLKHKQGEHQGITLMKAWETLSWDALWRIAKMYIKAWVLCWILLILAALFIGVGRTLRFGVQQLHNQRLEL